MKKVVILKGPAGVGKSYTARKLISRLDKKTAYINVDEVLHFDTRNFNNDKQLLAIYNVAILTRNFLTEEFDIIIDYTFDQLKHLDFLIDKIKHSHVSGDYQCQISVIHLTAELETIKKRNKTRLNGESSLNKEAIEYLYKACNKVKYQDEHLLDTTKMKPDEVTKNIVGIINENTRE
jgi:predicted ABC-type ATPase